MMRRNLLRLLGWCSAILSFARESRSEHCSNAAEYTWEKRVEKIVDGDSGCRVA